MRHDGLTFVLWASHFGEAVAAVFVTELRRVGLPVKVVGLHQRATAGSFGLALVPDLTLEQAASHFHRVRCVIVPSSAERTHKFAQHPLFGELMAQVARRGVFIVGASSEEQQQIDDDRSLHWPQWIDPIFYPLGDDLVLFAQSVANGLLNQTLLPEDSAPFGASDVAKDDSPPVDEHKEDSMERLVLYVAASSDPRMLAGAIAGQIRQQQRSELQVMGMGAVYQTVKAIIYAQSYLQPEGIGLACIPRFVEAGTTEHPRKAIFFIVDQRTDGKLFGADDLFGGPPGQSGSD